MEACDSLYEVFVAGGVDRAVTRKVTLSAHIINATLALTASCASSSTGQKS
jgi:hypothetical protein